MTHGRNRIPMTTPCGLVENVLMQSSDNVLKDYKLARVLLVNAGIVTEVPRAQDGEIVGVLTEDEIRLFKGLTEKSEELVTLQKELKELSIKINAKSIVLKAQRDLWWHNVQLKYTGDVRPDDALHIDAMNGCLRKGVLRSAMDH